VTEQNYFQFNQQCYKQTKKGLAMGALASVLLADMYIQHMERKLYPILINYQK
jgi:hypothetical protein